MGFAFERSQRINKMRDARTVADSWSAVALKARSFLRPNILAYTVDVLR